MPIQRSLIASQALRDDTRKFILYLFDDLNEKSSILKRSSLEAYSAFVDVGVWHASEQCTMGRLSAQDNREEGEHEAEQEAVVNVQHNSRQESEHPNQLRRR